MILFGTSCLTHAAVVFAASPIVGSLVDSENLNGVEDVFLNGDLAYLPCREGHCLTICSIKDPSQPQVVGTFRDPDLDDVTGFALDGNTAYLASQSSHFLLIVDVTVPEKMKLLGKVRISQKGSTGPLYKMAYRDGYCYMSHQGEKKLYIVDVRDKSRPHVVGNIQVTTKGDGAYCVTMNGDYALVGTVFGKSNRLAVVNVADPAHPRMVGELTDPHLSEAIGTIVDDRFYIACWPHNAMMVINLSGMSDTRLPYIEGVLVDPRLSKPNRCAVVGNRAYFPIIAGHGVGVVDISDPATPRFVTSYSDPLMKKPYGLAARGEYVFVGARAGDSLVILNRRALEK
ncbi:MAG: hypothetical protein CME33_26450 [Gimesia sp.]|nr:hypothetical protein [Gimesia sp.]